MKYTADGFAATGTVALNTGYTFDSNLNHAVVVTSAATGARIGCGTLKPFSFSETLKTKKATLGPDHSSTLIAMSNLAAAYEAAGELEEARTLSATPARSADPDRISVMTSLMQSISD